MLRWFFVHSPLSSGGAPGPEVRTHIFTCSLVCVCFQLILFYVMDSGTKATTTAKETKYSSMGNSEPAGEEERSISKVIK